jgi:uncharacterized protein YgiM (DUF1202 family)
MRRFTAFLCLVVAFSLACNLSQAQVIGSLPLGKEPTTTTPNPTQTRVSPSKTPARAIVTASEALNVRKAHGADQPVLVTLLAGASVTVAGPCLDGWVLVTFKANHGVTSGYVNSSYLSGDLCHDR